MKTLGIDTATEICGIAIIDGGNLIAEMNLNLNRAHSEKLIESIKQLMTLSDIQLNAIELIAISAGPGSFTGLRIGMAAAKGLAFSLKVPLTTVITLDALAFQSSNTAKMICPVIKARRDEVYMALYQKNNPGEIERVSEYHCLKLHELASFIPKESLMLGNGVIHFKKQIQDVLGESIQFAGHHDNYLRGSSIAYLGNKKYLQTLKDETESSEPFYIQEFISGGK